MPFANYINNVYSDVRYNFMYFFHFCYVPFQSYLMEHRTASLLWFQSDSREAVAVWSVSEAPGEEACMNNIFPFINRHKLGGGTKNICSNHNNELTDCDQDMLWLIFGFRLFAVFAPMPGTLINAYLLMDYWGEKYGPNHKTGQQFGFHSKPTPQLHLSACSTKYKHGQLRRPGTLPGVKLVIYAQKNHQQSL